MKSSLRLVYALVVFIMGIVLLSVLTVLFFYENRQSKASLDLVNKSNLTRYSLEKVYSTLMDAESAYNEYLLTRDSISLQPYENIKSIPEQFDAIDSLVSLHAEQSSNAKELRTLFNKRLQKLEHILKQSRRSDYISTPSYYQDLMEGYALQDSARTMVIKMQSMEADLLHERQTLAEEQSVLPTITGIGVSIISIVIFIIAFYFINTELRKTNSLNNELEGKNLQLENYAKELSSFTHVITHDMQEPLRKIQLFISVIENKEKENLTQNALHYFDKITQSVTRMRQLFISMIDFSFTSNGKNRVEEVDLNIVLKQTLESLKVYIKDTNAIIESDYLPKVNGVRYQLLQLFENILSNSLKYKRDHVIPEIQISCKSVSGSDATSRSLIKDRQYYKISFKDNGIGFDQIYADKIFEIFQRLHVKNDDYGVGIGLSMCRKIANNHEGIITATSEVDKGSIFSFYIPADYGIAK